MDYLFSFIYFYYYDEFFFQREGSNQLQKPFFKEPVPVFSCYILTADEIFVSWNQSTTLRPLLLLSITYCYYFLLRYSLRESLVYGTWAFHNRYTYRVNIWTNESICKFTSPVCYPDPTNQRQKSRGPGFKSQLWQKNLVT